MSNIAQRSFTGGELAPALFARTDLIKYATGLRTCRNFLVNRYGGVSNRPGTQFVGGTKANGEARFIRFVFSNEQTYLLEFGDRYIRFYTDGGRIVISSATAWLDATDYVVGDLKYVIATDKFYYCKQDHTSSTADNKPGSGTFWEAFWHQLTSLVTSGAIYEIPSPYLAADLPRLQTLQDGDTLTVVHPSYAPQELKRFDHTLWTLTPVVFGPSVGQVQNVADTGGDSSGSVDTFYAVTAVSEQFGDEGLPGLDTATDRVPTAALPIALTWDPVAGARSYRVYRSIDGQTYGFLTEVGGLAITHVKTVWTDNSDAVATLTTGSWVQSGGQARMTVLSLASERAVDGKYTVKGRVTLALDNPGDADGRIRMFYSRDSEPRVDAGLTANLSIAGGTFNSFPFEVVVSVPDNGYTSLVIDLVPEVFGSFLTSGFATCTVDETTAPDDSITWIAPQLGFSDNGLTPQFDIAPPVSPNLFSGPGLFPAAVGSFQQRRLYAGASLAPAQVRASRTGVPQSFTSSTPLQDDDALVFALSTWTRTEIRHLRDLARLVVFASSGEWVIEGDNRNILAPNAINARQVSAFGATFLAPLQVGAATLFLQSRQTIVRDLVIDTVQGASSSDLSVFAAHLFDGYTIDDWDFQQIPHGVVWAVRSDGVLLGLTYLPEQQVWGWHRHDTDGAVENVCVVPEGNEDAVYLLVRRTIDGATVRYVERMTSRAITALTDPRDLIFMDAALSYDGRNTGATTMTLSGGTNWDEGELLTITASVSFFTVGMVGGALVFFDEDGVEILRIALENFSSGTVMTGHPNKSVPVELRAVASTSWGHAAITFSGLEHLEGKAVSVLGDGLVQASPNNDVYGAPLVVDAGSVAIPTPACVVHIGLPYLSDVETLDIDTAQGPSLKPFKSLINKFTCVVESSKPFFVGGAPPSGTDPLENLDEVMRRDVLNDFDPLAIRTGDFSTVFSNRWNSHGRVFVRQPDPVPTTLLAIIPEGAMAPTN